MKHFALLILALSFLSPAFGQIVTKDQVEKKAERKASQRVDRRIDQSMDKGLDAIEDAIFRRNRKNRNTGSAGSGSDSTNAATSDQSRYMELFDAGSVDVKEQYDFDTQTDIKVVTTDKKGKKEEMKYRMFFSVDKPWFGMEMLEMTQQGAEGMFMIFDMENKQMVTLTESNGQKMGFAMGFDPEEYSEFDETEEDAGTDSDISFRKTGRTKTIQGYTCEEYYMESEDGNGEMWITKEDALQIGFAMAAFGSMQQQGEAKQQMPSSYPSGTMLEMEYREKDGSKMFWTTEDIKRNINHSISTSGYQIMGMPGGK